MSENQELKPYYCKNGRVYKQGESYPISAVDICVMLSTRTPSPTLSQIKSVDEVSRIWDEHNYGASGGFDIAGFHKSMAARIDELLSPSPDRQLLRQAVWTPMKKKRPKAFTIVELVDDRGNLYMGFLCSNEGDDIGETISVNGSGAPIYEQPYPEDFLAWREASKPDLSAIKQALGKEGESNE